MISRPKLAGRYELGPLLGRGGMGEVYRARDISLGREVALKILRPEHAGSREFVVRFEREAKNVASFSHPNIVRVFDAGEAGDGTRYIAMECVSGGTLADLIRKGGALAPHAAVRVALQLAAALSYAHERGIVHRDLKPQNVLMTAEGDARMADFGIARAAEATVLTRADMVVGSVGYLSPEQARGEPVDHRTDLYALGVVLYEMLTGGVPFVAESPIAVAMKHATQPPPSPTQANPAVPADLAGVTLKLLSKDPADRYASAVTLMADLERLQEGRPLPEMSALASATAPMPASAGEATTVLPGRAATMVRARRRRRRISALAVAVCGLAALAAGPLALGDGRIGGGEPETVITRSLAPSVAEPPETPEKSPGSPAGAEKPEREEPADANQVPASSATAQVSVAAPRDDVSPRSAREPESREPRAAALAGAGRIEAAADDAVAGVSSPKSPEPPDGDTPVVGTSEDSKDGAAMDVVDAAIEAARD